MDPLPLKEPMPRTAPLPYSVLDLSPILPGSTAADSFRATVDLAQHAERWGYRRSLPFPDASLASEVQPPM